MKLATMSASAGIDSMPRMALASSAGACGKSCTRLERPFAQGEPARFDLAVDHRGFLVSLDARHQEGLAAHVVEHREPLFALGDQMVRAVRRGDEPDDGRSRADRWKRFRRRIGARLGLQDQSDAGADPAPGSPPVGTAASIVRFITAVDGTHHLIAQARDSPCSIT